MFETLSKTNTWTVKSTTDYDKFTIPKLNRAIRKPHLHRLTKSMERCYIISPTIVNEKFEIIDGQHRFLAAKSLGKPIYYMVIEGYGNKEMQIYNANSANWTGQDFLEHYASLGIQSYVDMKQFMETFPDLTIKGVKCLLRNSTMHEGHDNKGKKRGEHVMRKDFAEGNLEIADLSVAYENARKIMEIGKYYSGYHRSVFVATMVKLFNTPNYNHDEFVQKLSLAPSRLTDCLNFKGYIDLMEDIYNHRRKKKVSLKY